MNPSFSIPHTVPSTIQPYQLSNSFYSALNNERSLSDCDVAIIGCPDDTGVALNNGRPGAKEGPSAFRKALSRYAVGNPATFVWPRVFDAGDILPASSLEETHDRVSAAVEALLGFDVIPFVIGGGHDLTYPVVRALHKKFSSLTGIYFDAHLDVRSETGSGMPFRKILQEGYAEQLHVFGLNFFVNACDHYQWFLENGGHIGQFQPEGAWPSGDLFVSLDVDVLGSVYAPGVSAANPAGWTPSQAEAWAYAAGRSRSVRCFDIMELNPTHDESARTAHIAAHLFLTFLKGVSERGEQHDPT